MASRWWERQILNLISILSVPFSSFLSLYPVLFHLSLNHVSCVCVCSCSCFIAGGRKISIPQFRSRSLLFHDHGESDHAIVSESNLRIQLFNLRSANPFSFVPTRILMDTCLLPLTLFLRTLTTRSPVPLLSTTPCGIREVWRSVRSPRTNRSDLLFDLRMNCMLLLCSFLS